MMKTVYIALGRLAYILAWPALFIYLRIGKRTRALVVCDGQLLLVKGWIGDGKWSLPGGGLHGGELPEVGVCREVYEETGAQLEPSRLQAFGLATYSNNGLGFDYYQFHVELKKKPQIRRQKREIVHVEWVDIESINSDNAEMNVLDVLAAWKRHHVSDTMK